MKLNISRSPLINALLFAIFWAIYIFVSKLAFLAGMNPMVLTVQSLVVCLLILAVYVLPKKSKAIKNITGSILYGLLIAYGIHAGIGGLLSNTGTSLTTAINAGFLVRFALVTTTFFAWLFLKEKVTIAQIIMIIILLLGTFFITTNGKSFIPHIGDILIIFACVAWSIGNVLTRKILKNSTVDADASTLLRPIAGLPLLIFFILLSPIYPPSFHQFFIANYFDVHNFYWSILVGVSVVLNWLFLNKTLKVASASYMSMMGMLTPVFVTFLAMVFLHETMTVIQCVGAVLIIVAGIVTNYLGVQKH